MTDYSHGYWRSLAELADPASIYDALDREFADLADVWPTDASRRAFLKVMGASLALAGVGGCTRQPHEHIVPYVRQPEGIVPGKSLQFATALPVGGDVEGVLVKSVMGRPIKIDGNPQHPANLGATSAMAQASLLGLYDPDRSQAVRQGGGIGTWDAFLTSVHHQLEELRGAGDASGLRVLTESITSPTLASQIEQLVEAFPGAKWHRYDAVGRDAETGGTQSAFGRDLQAVYQFDRADVVLTLDADPLGSGPGHVRYARDFSDRRRVRPGQPGELTMSRLYAVESTPATTGAAADHRLPLRPDEILRLTRALAAQLGVGGSTTTRLPAGVPLSWLNALVDDLQNYRPRGGGALVVPGMCTLPEVHALAHQINAALGSIGTTVQFIEPPGYGLSAEPQSLATLVDDMQAEQVDLLVILDGNPVYNAPTELDFAAALEKVSLIVHHSLYEDETSERCRWHLPATHPLESWSDAWAYDGTASIIQPLIAPLYDGRTAHEVLAMILESPERSNYDIVQSHWRNAWGDPTEPEFNTAWRTALHDGLVADSTPEPVDARPTGETANSQFSPAAAGDGEFQLLLRPDPSVWDGSLANNGWLQELPRPLTKLTWDNAALVSPATAERLTLEDEQVVEITAGERSLQAPVLVLPGQADDCVTLHLGYGRTRAGRVGTDCGVDAYPLRTSSTPWNIAGVTLRKTGDRYPLARTQHHHLMDGRDLVRSGLLAALAESPEHPEFMHSEHHAEEMSFYPEVEYNGNKWAMTVDLGACNGCNACVVACQAENNIPVVGKEQVRLGREMQWLRIDHYYEGEPANPVSHHQPVMCMHCEHAPCEIVCPVAATSHTDDGLNAMVYNRCVGTRYCSNNCPYKVRRFNFLQYSDKKFPVLELLNNPQVTVRDRGVMEKCTYCVQRISTARIDAERERRPIADGEVRTACQAACPSQAINFGDLNDEQSQVAALDHSPIRYGLLEELNTRPRTTYLADVRNPNPSIT